MKIFTSTRVTWPDPSDAPGDESDIDNAHVVYNGDRMTIRKRTGGRMEVVDTLINVTMKGSGEHASVTGQSMFMIDKIGLPPEEAEVHIDMNASNGKCLTC